MRASRSKPTLLWGTLLTLALALAAFLTIQRLRPQLELGVGYGARVACACRYIGNRPLVDCKRDFEPGMEQIRLSEDPAQKTVTARVPFLATRTARFDPVLGCPAEPFRGAALRIKR
jgi:hypothetical protein